MDPGVEAEIAVIGGSGFYELLTNVEQRHVETPFGLPSSTISIGEVGGRSVAFLPRHGSKHELPPHKIPFRANIWALRELGVSRILAPCAAGSLRLEIRPGDFVVCDQLIDRTNGREDTFFDGPGVNHVSLAEPYCPELRAAALQALRGQTAHTEGTVVVVQGPRFSTRAESKWYRLAGADVINMTQYPEVTLARELGMCYSAIALATDYDSGVEGAEEFGSVTMEGVFALLTSMVDTLRSVLGATVSAIPARRLCGCAGSTTEGPLDES